MAEEIRRSWNTLIPYMEQIAALMQEKLENADMSNLEQRLSQPVLAT